MRVARGPAMMAGACAAALALAVGAVLTAGAATTGNATTGAEHPAGAAPARPADAVSLPGQAGGGTRAVRLATGEQVQVSQRDGAPVVSLSPGRDAARARAMTIGDHAYVVPDSALPRLGHDLPLAAFDVTAPAAAAAPGAPAAGPAAPAPGANPQYAMTTLTLRAVDRNGAKAISGSVAVDNVDELRRYANMQAFSATGEVSFSVPVGHYSIAAEVATITPDAGMVADSLIFLPEIEVAAPSTVIELDARKATTAVPAPTTPKPATVEQLTATYGRTSADGLVSSISFMLTGAAAKSLYVTPTAPVTLGSVHWYTYFRLNGPAGTTDPYLYDVQFPSEGAVPSTFATSVAESTLATVDGGYHSDVADQQIATYRSSKESWELIPIRFSSSAVAPMRRTEYVSALTGVDWASGVVWNASESNGVDLGPWAALKPGDKRTERHLPSPLVPGVDAGTAGKSPCGACRQGDKLSFDITAFTGSGGRLVTGLNQSSTLTVSSAVRLYADEKVVPEATATNGAYPVPTAAKAMRMELDTVKTGAWTTTSTKVNTVWKWSTKARTGILPEQRVCADGSQSCAFEPLLFLEYDAGVNLSNGVTAGTATRIGVRAYHQVYDSAPAADALTFEVSADDGATWKAIDVATGKNGEFTASVVPSLGNGFLAFRVRASDRSGSSIDQTILRAVKVTG